MDPGFRRDERVKIGGYSPDKFSRHRPNDVNRLGRYLLFLDERL
jgi:hypothetical protein